MGIQGMPGIALASVSSQQMLCLPSAVGLSHTVGRGCRPVLPGRLGSVLEMVQPRDKRPVEHPLHACYVGLDRSTGEGFGGFCVSAGRCRGEYPFVHAGNAIAGAAPQDT
jgi:hypothetical protein